MKDKPIIMYDAPEAASIKTVTGWISSAGRYWGDYEHGARYDGATHMKCKNNPDHPIHETRGYCRTCSNDREQNQYDALEPKLWDGESPVAVHYEEEFFFSIADLFDYLCDREIKLSDIQLVHCTPTYPREIDPNEYYEDDLPDGGEISAELWDAFEALNEVIKSQPPICWHQDKYKVEFSPDQIEQFNKSWDETQEATEKYEGTKF